MGIDYHDYIGPYLRVTETVEKKQIDQCAEHNRGDSDYCPKCGKSKKDRIFTYEDNNAPDDWEMNYKKDGEICDIYDYLFSTSFGSAPDTVKGKRTYLYLPNRFHDELAIPQLLDYPQEIPFEELNVKDITKAFLKLFKDEIAYLEQWFEVEIKFGYVNYYS